MDIIFRMPAFFLLFFFCSVSSWAQDQCNYNNIVVARSQYQKEMLTECVGNLKPCLERGGFSYNEKIEACALCAMSYLAMDSANIADSYIRQLLELDIDYSYSPDDPERFRLAIESLRGPLRSAMSSSVSKKAGNIALAPATMQIITAADIKNRGYTDIESIFSDLPGFDVSRTFGVSYSVLYQRGCRAPALTERTMIMIDGVEDNDIWTNAAFISKQYPVSNIKRIEIIYGPASTLYGANAFSGVINIVTKDEDDLFKKTKEELIYNRQKNHAISFHTGGGSFNTKFVDGTLAARNKNVTLTVTGRYYTSDGVDLSSQPDWDGRTDYGTDLYASKMSMNYSPDSVARYVGPYFRVNTDSTKIVPTAAGIQRADSIDQAVYKTALTGAGSYRNHISDMYLSAKLTMTNFKFGFQYWSNNEGAIGDYVDKYIAINDKYSRWQNRQYFLYARYDKKITRRFNVTSFTYYRLTDFGTRAALSTFSGFANGNLTPYDFITNSAQPRFNTTYYYAASDQVRSELKGQFAISDNFDALVGSEFTSSIIQNNYLTTPNGSAIIYGHAPDSAGGNSIIKYTFSGYSAVSYTNRKHKFIIDICGRIDNNRFRVTRGYGTIFSPRLDIVYYPKNFIFKAIYTEAFLDPSNQNRFGVTSSRRLNNPALTPERIKNIELSGRYKWTNSYVELAAYEGYYTHAIALVVVPYAYNAAGVTTQFQNAGRSRVFGLQAASEISIGQHISVYSNVTYTDPRTIYHKTNGGDSIVRTGDIAAISGNVAINASLLRNKLNVNTRVNMVGDKPTGTNTSVTANPYTSIQGFALLNCTIGYRLINNILLQGGCNNILNTTYYSPGVRNADGSVYAARVIQAPRNYYTRLVIDL